MSGQDWDFIVWQRANDLLQKTQRIHRNFLQVAASARYRAQPGRSPSWEPPVNIVETGESVWVISALAGVAVDGVHVRLEGRDLVITGERPLPPCCQDGELKVWEIPLGRFERRVTLVGEPNSLLLGTVSFHDGLLSIELRKNS